MAKQLSFVEQVEQSAEKLNGSLDRALGKGLNIPNNASCSGNRKIMDGTHQSHSLVLSRGDMPYVATGYENRFGDESSTIIKSDADYEVIAKISKFSYAPDHHYYLILRNLHENKLEVVERISYVHRTEAYGFLINNSILDSMSTPGTIIPKDEVVVRSTGFDEYGNKANGANINICYMALDNNMEDSLVISDECSQKLSAPLVRSVSILINENDIPLNLYGNDDIYKIHPDIGEEVKDGILMGYRREKREESIYTQSVRRLQQIMMSDTKITVKGRVIDIDIMVNNIDNISNSIYNSQFLSYYNDRIRMNNEIIRVVGPYQAKGYNLSVDLQTLFARATDEINGVKFLDKSVFSNIEIKFVIVENRILDIGDKVADRYGGKGVVSKIIPKHLMPKMPNGQYVEMIKNSSTMYNRENAGQVFEIETNYISMNILDRIRNSNMGPDDALEMILKFLEIESPEEAEAMKTATYGMDEYELSLFIDSILNENAIHVSNAPITDGMDIDKLNKLYSAFPWINEARLTVPITGSDGTIRYVPTRRPMVAAPQYCLRLKQFAEEKFSAASLSSTNIKGENAKSKAAKNYKEPNSNTPIKFGQMETGNFDHMGSENVAINLMIHSLSPHARKLVEQIATGDPYNVNVRIDSIAKNRSAEILNARLKTMGYRLVFSRKKKEIKCAMKFLTDPMAPAMTCRDKDFDFDHYYETMDRIEKIKKKAATWMPAVFYDDIVDEKKLDKEEKS